jgi:hypothetical protein
MSIILPPIGSSGSYTLKPPLDVLINENERYVCKGIRNISDYIASNEDVKNLIYVKYGLIEDVYLDHLEKDIPIVSLQSDVGHWIYIPADYILTYPITNGIPYRSVMIGISLPSLPTTNNLTNIENSIRELVIDTLGVTPVLKQVETSRVILVPSETHTLLSAERSLLITNSNTDSGKYSKLEIEHQKALDKITELEDYIKSKKTVLGI